MNPILRIIGIIFIFGCSTIAWLILGGVMEHRTGTQTQRLHGSVSELWGDSQSQRTPTLNFRWTTKRTEESEEKIDGKTKKVRKVVEDLHSMDMSPASSRIKVGLKLDERLKGLLWYALYDVDFDGTWTYVHTAKESGELDLTFPFADPSGLYDRFQFSVNGVERAATLKPVDGKVTTSLAVAPGDKVTLVVRYLSRGLDDWSYVPGEGVTSLEDFALTMSTDFADIDFPPGSMSPSAKTQVGSGWALEWKFDRVVTGHHIGMVMPTHIQPGELASHLAFFAPVSLLFFSLLMFVLTTLRGIELHPINYLFLSASFFAFHLLFGYSVDHLTVVPSFILSSVVSTVLVVTYLRVVVGPRFAFVEAALGQIIYLVGFSLAHFWEGYTGLTVTVLSILTLFVMMQLTARVRWSDVFSRKRPAMQTAPT